MAESSLEIAINKDYRRTMPKSLGTSPSQIAPPFVLLTFFTINPWKARQIFTNLNAGLV